jgi:hypothetical protein
MALVEEECWNLILYIFPAIDAHKEVYRLQGALFHKEVMTPTYFGYQKQLKHGGVIIYLWTNAVCWL